MSRAGCALICGSVAFDTVMNFEDYPPPRREYGGSAGNMAYSMRFLGDCGVPMATVGSDAVPYLEWMRRHGIPTDCISIVEKSFTAHAIAAFRGRRRIAA